MSENGMGSVDNHANVDKQVIVNIQNMSGNIVAPNTVGAETKSSESARHGITDANFVGTISAFDNEWERTAAIMKGLNTPLKTVSDVEGFDWNLLETIRESFCGRVDAILEASHKMQIKDDATQVFVETLQKLYKGGAYENSDSGETWIFDDLFDEDAMDFECNDIDETTVEDFESWNKKFDAFQRIREVIWNHITSFRKNLALVSAAGDFGKYLEKAKSKYSTIKTLLYSDQPKPFYDFYVCNDIKREIRVPGKFGTTLTHTTIGNVTVKSLMDCSRFVILAGTGGLGKSMMMRHLLLNAIENYTDLPIIPVFIPLKDFDETVENLFEYVFSKVMSLYGDLTDEQFAEVLEKGKCLLLFDGLDEIGSTYARQFERELEAFTDKYPDNCFVISSRPYQTFVSYSRFTVLQLQPFSRQQAVMLIDNLEFRTDEPAIKEKFRTALNESLYRTHSTFIQNPLLLTIMLLTFEQYAEVPSKMHLFYREAFAALSVKHDASKGAYKRTLKTGLTADKFADYFAELCSRSYHDEKFEMTEDEFAKYYNVLKERERLSDISTTACDYLYDLCSNMCLMYYESGKYHFTHRSFQEYFCALYFSKQKDKNLESIGDFFENRRSRMFGDRTFNMLYDMIPDKVEEYIFLPYLNRLFEQCDSREGYWTFLENLYPSIGYEKGDTNEWITNDPQSYIYAFIKQLDWRGLFTCNDFPHYDSLVTAEFVHVIDEDGGDKLVNKEEVDWEYENEYGVPDVVGWAYEFDIEKVRQNSEEYEELLTMLDDAAFKLKEEYSEMREYLEKLRGKQMPSGSGLFDLFI
jgi:hypothetical protein